jgi:nucleotide-binding universal stress UspA family protein
MSIRKTVIKAHADARKQFKEAKSIAKMAGGKIKFLFPGWQVKSIAYADSPAWALVKKANQEKSDLIVVGARGLSGITRFLGSVSQLVLTQAPCSVRIARNNSDSKGNKLRIVIGIDGSPDSVAAVQAVKNRHWPPQTEFFLVSVIDPKKSSLLTRVEPAAIRWFLEQADDEATVLGRMMETYAVELRERGFLVTCEVKRGDPKRVLVEEAEALHADCIFIGARGLTHLKRLFLGGVSAAVAAHAHSSVEVVRAVD